MESPKMILLVLEAKKETGEMSGRNHKLLDRVIEAFLDMDYVVIPRNG